jgi:hypothetical protein
MDGGSGVFNHGLLFMCKGLAWLFSFLTRVQRHDSGSRNGEQHADDHRVIRNHDIKEITSKTTKVRVPKEVNTA